MPDNFDLLRSFRQYLVDQGLVRKASVAGAARPMHVEPPAAYAPGEREAPENDDTTVVSVFVGGDVPMGPFEGDWIRATIDVRYRTVDPPDVLHLNAQIRQAIVDRWDWDMGGLRVVESLEWAGLQRLGASEAQGWDYVSKFLFQIYA